ncbi:hypothetical protein [Pandoraea sputorum]|uniref:Uncharacterized protein n=1 Tax=Pandoraea sputorum TaxID=93222 RepID=A0A5E5B6K5_9BURK|nr:hypothetical protein [Pandoraea sputorum]VVE79990.1 hypothetical protein PSP31121_02403 [Pandoraea sputorum]
MQQDRHYMLPRIGHYTSRDVQVSRVRALPSPTPPRSGSPHVRCRRVMRGAALLDVLFTMTALVAGAQGFAHWQAAGGVSSATGGVAHNVVTTALPSPATQGVVAVDRLP